MARISVLILVVFSLTGCETVRGFGQDLSNVGDAILGR